MAKYRVTIQITRTIDVFGRDEDAAMDKACEIVSAWPSVDDVEAVDAEEIEE